MALIRAASSQDTEQILNIWFNASLQAHAFIPASFWQAQLLNMRDLYLPLAENYVIAENTVVHGFLSLFDNGQFIAALFIAPKFQKQGWGSKLIHFAQQQSTQLNLQVYTENNGAVQFYLHHGFSIVNESVDEHTHHTQFDMRWIAQSI